MTPEPARPLPPVLQIALRQTDCLPQDLAEALCAAEDIEGVHFTGVTFGALSAPRAAFRGCLFEKCAFDPEAEAPLYDFLDCAFQGSDLAGTQFTKGAFQRTSFSRCRCVGANWTDAFLRNVSFDDCQLSYANFGSAKCKQVRLTACDMSGAGFGYATFDRVAFFDCRLSGAEFFGAKLRGIDLRTNRIDGIVLADRMELEGAIISSLQAPDLVHLLGVTIRD